MITSLQLAYMLVARIFNFNRRKDEMKHLTAQELIEKGEHATATLEGWVDTIRNQGKILFIVLRNEH